jgi:DNA-binding NtrC family response regulator
VGRCRVEGKYIASMTARIQDITFPDPKVRTPTILIVEDEALIRIALSDFLQECGFKVLEAANAEEAIEIIGHGMVTIDLVFSDVVMPGRLDGFGLAHWMRANRPDVAVILTSGDAKKAASASELCARQPFLAKPYDLGRVVAQIRAMLGNAG